MDLDKIFPVEKIFHLVALDKLDEFVDEISMEIFDINEKNMKNYSLIDVACKYGSEKCFTYLKLKGATISEQTSIYAIEGGNKNIIISLYNNSNFEITDKHLTAALKYHHNEIFDWLLETKGSIGDLNIAECFYYYNLKGLLFLIENGFEINSKYVFQKLFIFVFFYSTIIFVYTHYIKFINHICLSLL